MKIKIYTEELTKRDEEEEEEGFMLFSLVLLGIIRSVLGFEEIHGKDG